MQLLIDGTPVQLKIFTFPGGEVQVRILDEVNPDTVPSLTIEAHLTSADALMTLLLLTDAARRRYRPAQIHLICPYLPYARQDRVVYAGEALSASVLCRLLNAQDYATVEVWDAHSDVSLALLDRVVHRHAAEFVVPSITSRDVLVAPDQGAIERVRECAMLSKAPMVHAEKVRDPNDGRITGTAVHSDHIGTRDFLIIDDICDGGRTFTALAETLRPLTDGRIRLYVTHGIFSAGFEPFIGCIDEILVARPFAKDLPAFVRQL
jgi:ribose-phosphate pyrophosphokinase